MADDTIYLNLGEWWAGNNRSTVVVMNGLGSCLGISLYNPAKMVGAAAHVVLPNSRDGQSELNPAKFADTVLPFLLSALEKYGCHKSSLILRAVGGANVINFPRPDTVLSIGTRNIDTFNGAAKSIGLPIQTSDLGGTHGRTMRFYLGDGKITSTGLNRELKTL